MNLSIKSILKNFKIEKTCIAKFLLHFKELYKQFTTPVTQLCREEWEAPARCRRKPLLVLTPTRVGVIHTFTVDA